MAKKSAKKAAKKAAKKPTPKKVTKPAGKPKPARPRSQPLPGMEQARDVVLDRACEEIAAARGEINAARVNETHNTQVALQRMQQRGATIYKHAGVELVRVPGVDKLRVRTAKEGDEAEFGGGEMSTTKAADEDEAPLDELDEPHIDRDIDE